MHENMNVYIAIILIDIRPQFRFIRDRYCILKSRKFVVDYAHKSDSHNKNRNNNF